MLLNTECCVLGTYCKEGFQKIEYAIELNNYLRDELRKMNNIVLDSYIEQGYKCLPNKTAFKIIGLSGEEVYRKLV